MRILASSNHPPILHLHFRPMQVMAGEVPHALLSAVVVRLLGVSFEVLLFATRHALVSKDYQPLYAMSQKPRFIQRWHELGPDLAAAALLIHHASAIGSDEALDKDGTLPFYRLVCLTFPVERLGATCNTISLLRGGGPSADKKTAAADALASFVQRTTSSAPSQP